MKALVVMLAVALTAVTTSGATAEAQPLEFKLGFKTLAALIPSEVGDPRESEHYGTNGDSLQQTSRGLMVWRKADNWTAFTNGGMTWINGPYGLASRLNEQLFEWERPTAPANAPQPQVSRGLILYQADWSTGANGWATSLGWRFEDGLLVNDGSTQNAKIVAPYQPPVASYAVEAEIQIADMAQYRRFGVMAREGYLGGMDSWNWTGTRRAYVGTTGTKLAGVDYNPGGSWHRYRLEVEGSRLRLWIDGILMGETTDNSFRDPGTVGIWSSSTSINVRNFQVIAL